MAKIWVYALAFLMLFASVMAYDVNETITIDAQYREDGVVKSSTAYISIFLPNGDINISNIVMSTQSTGVFEYNYTAPDIEGEYEAVARFFVGSVYKGEQRQSFSVGDVNRIKWGVCPSTGYGYTLLIVIMVIMILLGVVGLVLAHLGLTFAMAIMLIFLSAISWSCGWIIGTLNLVIGIVFLVSAMSQKY